MWRVPDIPDRWRRGLRITAAIAAAPFRILGGLLRWGAIAIAGVAGLMLLGNVIFHSPRDLPHRALDPRLPLCDPAGAGWDVLARANAPADYVANDEWAAIDQIGGEWRQKLTCAIQRHVIPGATGGTASYDLAFLEFQEDGKPYALRVPCDPAADACADEGQGPVRRDASSQLTVLLDRLRSAGPHYVLVFIHGWRHDASLGDENVGNLRHYAAHAAHFLADRTVPGATVPKVTAVFVGWRGARTDETWLKRRFGHLGSMIGALSAVGTLFDRKPVSEAVAPAVLAGLRAIEETIGIAGPLPPGAPTPPANPNRMIVFGHSLGGNLLAVALKDDLIKGVMRHAPAQYMLPPLGDLVVLINPASEATKWTDVQRAVWTRIATSRAERRPVEDYVASHDFFRRDQRPLVVAVTAARDWPPGGRRELDCTLATSDAMVRVGQSRALLHATEYDWATYDLFPAFKGDLRPLADTLRRFALQEDPHDACDQSTASLGRRVALSPFVALAALLRVLPFQQTDPELTHTIGNYDPPRAPRGRLQDYYVSARPFGTTHELRGPTPPVAWRKQSVAQENSPPREIPVDYDEIGSAAAACPPASGWLTRARETRVRDDPGSHGTFWSSDDAGETAPALQFLHGFSMGGVAAITRANDPFWNMRAFDTALARHDGYMLSSFICAMHQLVMDAPTSFPASPASATPPPAPSAAE